MPNINFNPHSPQGGATNLQISGDGLTWISIHTPRKGERHSS